MQTAQHPSPPPPLTDEERMLRYGYRLVPKTLADGSRDFDYVALTLEDLLHPQMGDVAVESSLHDLERGYLRDVFRSRLKADPEALVLSDCCTIWDIPDLRNHSPDVSVIFDVHEKRPNWKSFDVAEQGTRPHVIIEIVSPDSRENDVTTKVTQYHLARVPFYYIVDRKTDNAPPRLIGYQWMPHGYDLLPADANSRYVLDRIGVALGLENDRVACFDIETGERLGDYSEVATRLAEEKKNRREEKQRADKAEQRADKAEKQAQSTAQEYDEAKQRADRAEKLAQTAARERDEAARERDEAARERDEAARERDEAKQQADERQRQLDELRAQLEAMRLKSPEVRGDP